MIRLTPLRETASFQEAFKEEWLKTLLLMIQRKFALSVEMQEALQRDLQTLDAGSLKTLIRLMLEIHSVEALEQWTLTQVQSVRSD